MIAICEQAIFLCVSETCDSSQYCVGESHSLSGTMCPYVRNTRYMVLFMTIYTDQKLEKNPLMVVSEQSERAEIFFLHFCVRNICFFLYRPENQKLEKKLYMIASKPFFYVCV